MRFEIFGAKKNILLFTWLFSMKALSQTQDSSKEVTLPAVVITAFEQQRKLKDVPAPVNYLGRQMFENFNTSSIVAAVNTAPGVRMEERSPGSYRLNIRGSSLRSPFGVRNVKIYFNDIPFTDPGGQSFLNQLGTNSINSIEIIKGSNNSIYGAGTGGVMLIESLGEKEQAAITAEYGTGSYNLQNYNTAVTTVTENFTSRYGLQFQEGGGYRDHSSSRKTVASWNGVFRIAKDRLLKTTFLYGDLFYETPGALTLSEFNDRPKSARPGNATTPGAIQANAFIKQRSFLAGATYIQPLTATLQNKTTLYGMYTQLINPNLRNYEQSSLPHFGGRTVFKFEKSFQEIVMVIDAGGEVQQGFTSLNIHKNRGGNADSLVSNDNISNQQAFVFIQSTLEVNNWTIMTGASWNSLQVKLTRFTPALTGSLKEKFDNEIAPRLSVMRKLNRFNIYAGVAKGFSPPTTSELLPSGGLINAELKAERGINYELGVKGNVTNNIYFDVNLFAFSLRNTIVQRRDAAGGDYYINAGSTRQHGAEVLMNYPFFISSARVKKSLFWVSYSWHDFHYKQFKQLTNDFGGKRLPSVPKNTLSSGIDFSFINGWSGGVNYYFNDKNPLNDGNTEFAATYHLLGARIGFEKSFANTKMIRITAGLDNLLNERYSLGNDINAFGGRYYNAAPLRNFYLSLLFRFMGKKG